MEVDFEKLYMLHAYIRQEGTNIERKCDQRFRPSHQLLSALSYIR